MAEDASGGAAAEIISEENSVDSSTSPNVWQPASVGQKLAWHDRLRTGEDSRAAVPLGDLSILRLDELTEAEVLPPPAATAKPTVDLKQGTAYFFSREKSREINVQTPAANGGIRGTEFVVTVAADGATSFTMIDGEVETSNAQGSLVVRSGERADIEPGGTPVKTAVGEPIESARWCFFYPGVLDPREVMDSLEVHDPLQASLSAYKDGDLLMALKQYPPDQLAASPEEKVYRAGLLLIAGQVAKAESLLEEVDHSLGGRQALSTLIAAVTQKDEKGQKSPRTASEWLAQSYYLQSIGHLTGALQAAERATDLDPDFGFGWTRVGELELGQGRVPQAKSAVEKGLNLAPRNPAAHALRGFILSEEGKLDDAKDSFEKAMALDSALGEAWLGRGLCLIRQGQVKAGRRDLFTAAALEPNRAIFRSYLDKEFSDSDSQATTRKKKARRPGITADPGPYYPGLVPRPNVTADARPYYPGRGSRSGTAASPEPNYSRPTPRPGTKASPRPSGKESTPPPKTATAPNPRRPKSIPRPTPSKRPAQGQQIRRPKPTPPERGAIAPQVPGAQEQSKSRKKRPTAAQSPTPN